MSEIKNFVKTLGGKPILIFGLGKSGLSSIKALKKAGALLVAGDDSVDNIAAARKLGVEILGETQRDFEEYAFLLLSPGIPLTHPKPHDIVENARAAKLDIICDIELFSRIYPDMKTIGVTGTNGKSTTTTLIYHILNELAIPAKLGGNIGTAVFELDMSDKDAWIVLEISSFQMDLCPNFRPDIALVLNITPDHIDRHGDIEHYTEVKERITEIARSDKYNSAIICNDDLYTKKMYAKAVELGLRDTIEVSTLHNLSNGISVIDGILYDGEEAVGDFSEIQALQGVHNHQNAACAYAALRKVGLSAQEIWPAMQKFAGLNHRQYLVRTINGVAYVNDSKATNAASSAVALESRQNIYWIVGGSQKKTGLDGLEGFFPHIKHAFLIGDSTEDFANWFDKYGLEYTRCYNLDASVKAAHKMAQENRGQPKGAGAVLLSPACASFDQFKSFEERGNKFAKLVKALDE